MAQDSNLPTTRAVTSGFRPGTLPTQSAILERRAEQSKPTPCGAHSLATRPGAPVRFTLLAYPPWDSNPDDTRSERAGSTNWPRRARERMTWIEPATSTLATQRSDQLSYIRKVHLLSQAAASRRLTAGRSWPDRQEAVSRSHCHRPAPGTPLPVAGQQTPDRSASPW